jgi:hypothetical protein
MQGLKHTRSLIFAAQWSRRSFSSSDSVSRRAVGIWHGGRQDALSSAVWPRLSDGDRPEF